VRAFLSNNYYDSDGCWMELTGAIQPTIGPYECMRPMFNDKAGFEAYITVQDDARDGKPAEVRRRAAGHRGPSAHRPKQRNPKLGGWRRSSW